MKSLNSLWARLILGYAIPVVLFLGAALVAYITIHRLMNALESEQTSQKILTKLYKVKESISSMAASQRAFYLLGEPALKERYEANRVQVRQDLDELRERLESAEDPQAARHAEDRLAALHKISQLEEQCYELAVQDFQLRAGLIGNNFQHLLANINLREGIRLLETIRRQTDAVIRSERDLLAQRREVVQRTTQESIWAIAVAVLVSVLLSAGIAVISARSIAQPIHQLTEAFAELRHGKFEALSPEGPSEMVALIRGFNLMGIALAERSTLLESSELRYRTVVGTTSNLLWTTDASGLHGDMTSWCAYTGQDCTEAQDNGWLAAIHEEDRPCFSQHWQRLLQGSSSAETEMRIRSAEGVHRHFSCRSVPIFDSANRVTEWVHVCVDISERKQEERLRQEKEAAEAANRAKSEFLAKMSHELRTPLNAVIGMSKMLNTQRFGALNAKQMDYLSDITQAGEHLLALINDILDLSKVEAGRMDLVPEPVGINSTVELVLSTLRTLAESKHITLQRDLLPQEASLVTDLARLKQILYNLLSNAVKFTPDAGTVTVRCRWVNFIGPEAQVVTQAAAEALRVEVADTGIGISKEDQAKLGGDFFQSRVSSNQAKEGTGLGLALTRRLVQLLGGQIWFFSELDKGSCFAFALPLQVREAASLEEGSPLRRQQYPLRLTEHSSLQRPLVLIVDDHEPTNKLLADWLREEGIETAAAYDGKTGLEMALQLRPQLLLLDVRLPRLNGLQVLSRLKSNPETADIPVIINSVLESQEQGATLEVADWLVKPLDKERFLHSVRAACPQLLAEPSSLTTLGTEDMGSSSRA